MPLAPSTVAFMARLRSEHPEWSAYLSLVALALEEARASVWRGAVPEPDAGNGEECWLAGATVRLPERAAMRWVRRLASVAAAQSPALRPLDEAASRGRLDPIRLLEAALSTAGVPPGGLHEKLGVAPDALAALMPLLGMPFRHACTRAWSDRMGWWRHGHCPVCGAWPALAEIRGLENSRRLRCGQCGADWQGEWLRCPFCGNRDHTRLGTLVLPERGDTRRVDVCHACRAYVKALPLLGATPADEVVLQDLATLVLDVAAIEHGFHRPAPRPQPSPRLSAAPSRLSSLLGTA
jgi:FdhE protein